MRCVVISFTWVEADSGFALRLNMQEVLELCHRERRRQMPSLRTVTPQLSQHRELLPGFDGSGSHIQANGLCHTDQRPHDVDVVLVVADPGDA